MRKTNFGKGILLLFTFSFLLFTLFGCATTNNSGQGSSMSNGPSLMSSALKFDDVPMPVGFKLIDNESFSFQNDNMRVGLLRYSGMPDANKVINFYKEQMPMYNWDLINVIEYGQKVMNFERSGQTCIITIQPLSTRTIITIAVAPKAPTAMTQERSQKYKELKGEFSSPKSKSK